MRTISALLFTLLFFLLTYLFSTPAFALSVCTLTMNTIYGNKLPADFDGDIIFTSSGNCFTASKYYIIAYPDGANPETFFKNSVVPVVAEVTNKTPTKIQARFNINSNFTPNDQYGTIEYFGFNGKTHSGRIWRFALCVEANSTNCNNANKFLPEEGIAIEVLPGAVPTSTPTPTPKPLPADLPRINKTAQTTCIFRTGTPVLINQITNLKPKTKYGWWWENQSSIVRNSFTTGDFPVDDLPPGPALNSMSFEIPAAETENFSNSDKKFCIDLFILPGDRGCGVNGIVLHFTPGDLPPNTACTPQDAGNYLPPTPLAPPPDSTPRCNLTNSVTKSYECDTAIGTIPTNPAEFVKKIFGILLSLSGGVALLLIITSGYRLMISQGNPEKVQAAQETLTSAVVGLLFILFSLVILEIIGVDLLKIPGLTH